MPPTPRPPSIPVISLRVLVDIKISRYCKVQSVSIMRRKKIHINELGNAPKKSRVIDRTCPIAAPRHLAQNGIGSLLILKHLSGIPWQPRLIFLIVE